ncbi:hypothetical protein [Sporosarcina ureae]|uniref:hypothetical protein n=1 Tax=Sporosarcina ureae TaxID=1571 RepID=UPI0026F37966|nr:hypothetical protein [Sporosarcina ureae]
MILPEDTPEFVEVSDFQQIDWDKKAVKFGDINNIIGNENKSGVIGADMPSLGVQKWMWHLWGIKNLEATKLTVVGLHRETGTVHQPNPLVRQSDLYSSASGVNFTLEGL